MKPSEWSMRQKTMKNNIKELRKGRKMRQEDLAEKLGVTRQTVIAIENDKYQRIMIEHLQEVDKDHDAIKNGIAVISGKMKTKK